MSRMAQALSDRNTPNVRLPDSVLPELYVVEGFKHVKFRNTKKTKDTLLYDAPELLAYKSNDVIVTKPSRKTDVYACGIIIREVTIGPCPYGG